MDNVVVQAVSEHPTQPSPRTTSGAHELRWMFVSALLIRLLSMLLLHTYRLHPALDESMRISASLARGQGFSNPFDAITGPTAWLPPLYPWLLAGIFKIFGVYTRASFVAALSFNCLSGAVTTIFVYLTARRCFGPLVAKWSGWTWALLPYAIYWSIHSAWDTPVSTMLMAMVFFLTIVVESSPRLRDWAAYGIAWGVLALSNTAMLAFLPAAAAWLAFRATRRHRPWLIPGALAALMFFGTIAPWIARNDSQFHKFIPVRGNFGVELHLGNSPGANGTWQWWLHPSQNGVELQRYRQIGEAAYVAEKRDQALRFIRDNPGRFAVLSVKRFIYYWAGVPRSEKYLFIQDLRMMLFLASSILAIWGAAMAVRRGRAGAMLFVLLLATVPTIYYFVFPHARYRHPIEPEMVILAAYLVSETRPRRSYPADL